MVTASNRGYGASMVRGVILTVAVIGLCACAYLAGLYAGYKRTWPVSQMAMLFRAAEFASGPIQTDRFGRLLRFPGKTAIPCPPQDDETAVLLVFGQSNAANFQGQRYQAISDHIVNFSQGQCTVASSPLLGADGRSGEPWTLLGNKLVQSGLYRTVVLVPAAVGGSAVGQWAPGGNLNAMLAEVIRGLKPSYTITAILWHQGSADMEMHTTEDAYRSALKSLIDMIRAEGVTAPFYISKSSLVLGPTWSADNPIARAQDSLVDGKSILAGPDTDRDVIAIDRFDGLHMSATGQEKFANAWLELLRAHATTK